MLQPDIQKIIQARDWQHYLTRPFTIFGASLWHEWYVSGQMKQCLGSIFPDVLFLEEQPGIARCYRPAEQIQQLNDAAHPLIFDTKRAVAIFQEALQLNERALALLKGKGRLSLPQAVDFLIELSVKATVLPNRVGAFLDTHVIPSKPVVELMERLRSVSYYPRMMEEIIMPLAQQHLQREGIQNTSLVHVMTYHELIDGDHGQAEQRLSAQQQGRTYCYTVVNGKEAIWFLEDGKEVMRAIEPLQHPPENEIIGQIAHPGKAVGKVRMVNTGILKDIPFDTGDILVSVSTTPLYLPLMKRSGAIVTDEGGLASHAAILARELGKPCIIGTKNATRILKEGDVVEVDAEKGVVKMVKSKGAT